MNKSELVAKVTENLKKRGAEVNQSIVGRVVDGTLTVIQDRLYQEEDVKLVDFGTFSITKRAERKGHNPKTGEQLVVPPKNAVHFKPAKALKEYVQD